MYAASVLEKQFSWTHSAWDPTEPVATRPLFTQRGTGYKFFYTFDGNKNVSELVHFEARNGIAAHYDYAPFGAVTRAISASAITDNTFTTDNPFRFSSEYHDDTLGLVYYNYRHYNPIDGRWCGRDPANDTEESLKLAYLFVSNHPGIDRLGLRRTVSVHSYEFNMKINKRKAKMFVGYAPGSSIARQMPRYREKMIWDDYHVTFIYQNECTEDATAHIFPISVTGNLIGSFDSWGFSITQKGVGVALGGHYEVGYSNIKTLSDGMVMEIEVLVSVYKSYEVGVALPFVSIGSGISITRELVGEKTIRLKNSCCE